MKKKLRKAKAFVKRVLGLESIKIFCISFQRTGTTSTGQFFKDHGFVVSGYSESRKNDWTLKWFSGNHEAIFKSLDFKLTNVFEDDPWWCQDFYKILFHRFPKAKFILLERNSDKWFDSMTSHSFGKTLGNTYRHSKIYRREKEFYTNNVRSKIYSRDVDNLLSLDESHRTHYKEIYELRNREVKEFFQCFGNHRLFNCFLEDRDKWTKMGAFFGIKVNGGYEVHANKSVKA
jgi:Sulfotransferase domain